MNLNLEFQKLQQQYEENRRLLEELKEKINPTEDLWDIADVIKNWKVSRRTIMKWKSDNLIGYHQIGSKIYFSKKNRDEFLNKHYIKAINYGGEYNG